MLDFLARKKKKIEMKREDFKKISLLVLLLPELLQQSHLCRADCQVTACDTGERTGVRGGLRVVRQKTH